MRNGRNILVLTPIRRNTGTVRYGAFYLSYRVSYMHQTYAVDAIICNDAFCVIIAFVLSLSYLLS